MHTQRRGIAPAAGALSVRRRPDPYSNWADSNIFQTGRDRAGWVKLRVLANKLNAHFLLR